MHPKVLRQMSRGVTKKLTKNCKWKVTQPWLYHLTFQKSQHLLLLWNIQFWKTFRLLRVKFSGDCYFDWKIPVFVLAPLAFKFFWYLSSVLVYNHENLVSRKMPMVKWWSQRLVREIFWQDRCLSCSFPDLRAKWLFCWLFSTICRFPGIALLTLRLINVATDLMKETQFSYNFLWDALTLIFCSYKLKKFVLKWHFFITMISQKPLSSSPSPTTISSSKTCLLWLPVHVPKARPATTFGLRGGIE